MIFDSLLKVCADTDVSDGVTFTEFDLGSTGPGPGEPLMAYLQGDTLVTTSAVLTLKTSATASGASSGTALGTWNFTAAQMNAGVSFPLPRELMSRYNILVASGTWTSGALNAWIGHGPVQTNRG